MEERHITIISGDKEYYIDNTHYLIKGKFIFLYKVISAAGEYIPLKMDSLVDIRAFWGTRKALVMAASSKQYILLFRHNAEDEVWEDVDEFDRVIRRNGAVYDDYVYNGNALE
jgi:hypothetical protein